MGEDESCLRAAGEEAIEEILLLERQMNFYDPASDISRINRQAGSQPVKVEPQLFALIQECIRLSEATNGAFDITIAPLMQLWGFVQRELNVPTDEELKTALEMIGVDKLILDEDAPTLGFAVPGMKLDLGSVGKGYALDRCLELLADYEIPSALIHGGTSAIATIGKPLDGSEWRIGLEHPHNYTNPSPTRDKRYLGYVTLEGEHLGVSAIWGKSFQTQDRTYGHVIDPRTGWPTNGAVYSAIKGTSNTCLDILATTALVLGNEFQELDIPEVAGSLIYQDQNGELTELSDSFPFHRLEK